MLNLAMVHLESGQRCFLRSMCSNEENAFELKKQGPGLKFSPRVTTGLKLSGVKPGLILVFDNFFLSRNVTGA